MNELSQSKVEFVSNFDGYVYQAATTLVGKNIAIQTTNGTLQGKLSNVAPDHLVLDVSGVPFFIRTQQIVWITPAK